MSRITIERLTQLAFELETPSALAAALDTTEEAAERMLLLVDDRVQLKRREQAERFAQLEKEARKEPAHLLAPDSLPSLNPAEEVADWGQAKERAKMGSMSMNLLAAMLRAGQHYLSPEMAAQRRKELGMEMQLL